MLKKILIIIFFNLLITNVHSAGTSSSGEGEQGGIQEGPQPAKKYTLGYKEIKRAKKLEKKGKIKKAKIKYKKALDFLLEANAVKPGDPDTLNYLGFASRKLGDFENAEIYYRLGLEIEPNHNGINEYLGELYLNTNRKNKALERLKVLESCNCAEYKELKELIEGKKQSKY